MTTSTLTLTEFLEARIAEDEAVVRGWRDAFVEDEKSVRGPGWGHIRCEICDWSTFDGTEPTCEEQISEHYFDVHQARRILATCKAHRGIVAEWQRADSLVGRAEIGSPEHWGWSSRVNSLDKVLRALASIYADHPDFDSRWAL